MKYNFIFLTITIGLLFQSCNATKTKETEKVNTQPVAQQVDADKMISDGYKKGTLSKNKSETCAYFLTIDGMKESLDPINLDKFFKDEIPENVWVKFGSLRMKNRCPEARPVSITEISERTN